MKPDHPKILYRKYIADVTEELKATYGDGISSEFILKQLVPYSRFLEKLGRQERITKRWIGK